jgi:hypothetical protein
LEEKDADASRLTTSRAVSRSISVIALGLVDEAGCGDGDGLGVELFMGFPFQKRAQQKPRGRSVAGSLTK